MVEGEEEVFEERTGEEDVAVGVYQSESGESPFP